MATKVLLGTLMQRVRRRANLEVGQGVSSTQFVPDSEIIDEINVSIGSWWDLVRLTTFGGQYARAPWPILTGANISLYPLSANCASIISVDANINGQNYAINALGYNEENRNMFKMYPFVGWAFGFQNVFYQKQGENINFLPTPTAGYNIQVNYVPTAPVLCDATTDYLNSFNNWEEWIVCDAAYKLLVKDGQTDMLAAIAGMRQAEDERIKWAAGQATMEASEGVHEGFEPSNAGFGMGGGFY